MNPVGPPLPSVVKLAVPFQFPFLLPRRTFPGGLVLDVALFGLPDDIDGVFGVVVLRYRLGNKLGLAPLIPDAEFAVPAAPHRRSPNLSASFCALVRVSAAGFSASARAAASPNRRVPGGAGGPGLRFLRGDLARLATSRPRADCGFHQLRPAIGQYEDLSPTSGARESSQYEVSSPILPSANRSNVSPRIVMGFPAGISGVSSFAMPVDVQCRTTWSP